MTKVSALEKSGQLILSIFRCNGIQPGQKMLFPAISAQFMGGGWRGRLAPVAKTVDRLGHHNWSHAHWKLLGWQGPDLSAGIDYLLQRGYLRQGPENRIAYFLTDAGLAAS